MRKTKKSVEAVVKDIKRKTRRKFSAEEKIRINIISIYKKDDES